MGLARISICWCGCESVLTEMIVHLPTGRTNWQFALPVFGYSQAYLFGVDCLAVGIELFKRPHRLLNPLRSGIDARSGRQ